MLRSATASWKCSAAVPLLLLAAACERQPDAPPPTPSPTTAAVSTAVTTITPTPLDAAALDDRQDPDRVLRYYGAALAAGDWHAAAGAWGSESGVTGMTLQGEYGAKGRVTLLPGKGTSDAGCGSLYYEAPVTLRFDEGGEERTGTITLRRVNDVDGATPDQLRWHIERSTVGPKLEG